jgi:hypothetical protein
MFLFWCIANFRFEQMTGLYKAPSHGTLVQPGAIPTCGINLSILNLVTCIFPGEKSVINGNNTFCSDDILHLCEKNLNGEQIQVSPFSNKFVKYESKSVVRQ